MKKIPIVLSALVATVFGCKVDQINPLESNSPVFMMEGSVDQIPFRFIAGKDSVYHFTNFLESNSGISRQTGKFALQDCAFDSDSACNNSIEFIFADRANAGFELTEGSFTFVSDSSYSSKVYPITIAPLDVANLLNCSIRVNNIGTENLPLPLMTNLLSGAPVDITVLGQAKSGIKFLNTTTFIPTDTERCKPVYISITSDGSEITVKAKTLMAAEPTNYTWSSGVVGPEFQVDNIVGNLSVTVISDDGQCTATTTLSEVPSINGIQYNAPQYMLAASGEVAFDQQEGITVIWADEKGQRYSSGGVLQDNLSYFTITKVASYLSNENGLSTKSMDVSFRCYARPIGEGSSSLVPPKLIVGKGKIALGQSN